MERADDTGMALGSDIIGVALEGYGLLKVSGKGEGLKTARRELSARFGVGTSSQIRTVGWVERSETHR